MSYVITRKCRRAGDCVPVCPTDSIHFVEGDSEWPTYYINPDTCIECGACAAVCPCEAIFYEDDVPAEYKGDTARNAAFFESGPGKDLV